MHFILLAVTLRRERETLKAQLMALKKDLQTASGEEAVRTRQLEEMKSAAKRGNFAQLPVLAANHLRASTQNTPPFDSNVYRRGSLLTVE